MNENVENLILAQLREMRAEMAETRRELGAMRARMDEGFADIHQKVDGVSLLMAMLAGHVQHIETRVERIENKIGLG